MYRRIGQNHKQFLIRIHKKTGHIYKKSKISITSTHIEWKHCERDVRKKKFMVKNLRDWYHCSNNKLFTLAIAEIRLALIIANFRNEGGI